MSTLLSAALELMAWGYSIFPLRPHDKRPCSELLPTENGEPTWKPFTRQRPSPAEVKAWYKQVPDANIAIVCGAISNELGLDIDGQEGIDELRKYGKLPITPLSHTGKPTGWHVHFAHPGFPVPNKVRFLPGLDTRGESGYLVAPPSIHPNGNAYFWKLHPREAEKAQAPDWMLALLRPEPRHERHEPPREHLSDPNEDEALAILALDALDPGRHENYEDWFRVGASLKPLGATGLRLWDDWSARSSKYHSSDCTRRWDGMEGSSLAVLYWMADEDAGKSWRPVKPTPIDVTKPVKALTAPDRELQHTTWTSLPMTARAVLNAYAPTGVAPTLELWIEGKAAGLIHEGDPVTVSCLEYVSKKLNRGVRRQTIQKALDQDAVQFCTILSLYESSIGDTDTEDPDHAELQEGKECEGTDSDPCSPQAGRKATRYQLLPQDTILENLAELAVVPILKKYFPTRGQLVAPIRAEFLSDLGRVDADEVADDLDEKYGAAIQQQTGYAKAIQRARREYRQVLHGLEHPDMLPLAPNRSYGKAGEYVTECLRALLRRTNGILRLSKPKLVALIGCSERNLLTVLRRAGVWVLKDQFVESDPVTVEVLETIAKEPKKWNPTYQGYPLSVKSSTNDWPYGISRARLLSWARTELATGATLRVRYSQPNVQFQPCFEVWKRFALALLDALTAPIVVTQPELFHEPEPEVETVEAPAPVKAKVIKPEPKAEKPTYAEQWFEKMVAVGVSSTSLPSEYGSVHLVGDARPTLVQQSLDLLLYGVLPVEPEPLSLPSALPIPEVKPDVVWLDMMRQAWQAILAYLARLAAQCTPRPSPILLLPASCGP